MSSATSPTPRAVTAFTTLTRLLSHRFSRDHTGEAYEMFVSRGDGVLKAAFTP